MKLRVPTILAAVALSAMAAGARSGGEDATAKGVILSSQDVQIGTSGMNRVLTIRGEDGRNTIADLGPASRFKNVKMARGKMITLEGTPVRVSNQDVIFARRVVMGDQKITLTRNDIPDLSRVSAKSMAGAYSCPPEAMGNSGAGSGITPTGGVGMNGAAANMESSGADMSGSSWTGMSANGAAATIPTRVTAGGANGGAACQGLTQVDSYSSSTGYIPPADAGLPTRPGVAYRVHADAATPLRPIASDGTFPGNGYAGGASGVASRGANIEPGIAGFTRTPNGTVYATNGRQYLDYTSGAPAPRYVGFDYGGPTGTGSTFSGGTGLGSSFSSSAGTGSSMGGYLSGQPYNSSGMGSSYGTSSMGSDVSAGGTSYGLTGSGAGTAGSSRWWSSTPSTAGNAERNLSRADAVGSVTATTSSSFGTPYGTEWGGRGGYVVPVSSSYNGAGYGVTPIRYSGGSVNNVTSGFRDISGGRPVITGVDAIEYAPRTSGSSGTRLYREIHEKTTIVPKGAGAACALGGSGMTGVSSFSGAPAGACLTGGVAAQAAPSCPSAGSTVVPQSCLTGQSNQVVTVDTNYGPVVTTIGAAKDLNCLRSTNHRPIRINAVAGDVADVTAIRAGERPSIRWVDEQGRSSVRSTTAPNLVDRPFDAARFNAITVDQFCSGPRTMSELSYDRTSSASGSVSGSSCSSATGATATGDRGLGLRGIDLTTRYRKSATSSCAPAAAPPACGPVSSSAPSEATGRVMTGGMPRADQAEACDDHVASATMGAGAAASAVGGEIEVIATDFKFEPNRIEARAGQPIRLTFRNEGGHAHSIDFRFSGQTLALPQSLAAGDSRVVTFNAPAQPGVYTFYCPVGAHADLGMKGTLIVR